MSTGLMHWIPTKEFLPKEGLEVMTRIVDEKGERNVQRLKRRGNLWFVPDGSICVDYTPTHWKLA